jgi:hypothetical protein
MINSAIYLKISFSADVVSSINIKELNRHPILML